MIRSHQKFDLGPKLSLRVKLEGLNINKKYRVLRSASQQRDLHLNGFHPFCSVSDGLHCRIGDALRAPSMQPGCSSVNTLTRMKSNQIEVFFPGRSSQLGIFPNYTGPSNTSRMVVLEHHTTVPKLGAKLWH
jgi:hypothetical protein